MVRMRLKSIYVGLAFLVVAFQGGSSRKAVCVPQQQIKLEGIVCQESA